MSKIFPFDPFPDVNAQEFTKDNKKEVTEDFVAENFRRFGWNVLTPIRDLGVDLIIEKYVCPRGDTFWNKKEPTDNCEKCGDTLILITRYVQIKTRTKDSENLFGYTLKTRDFPTDPRHVFLLYSDHTQQFVILPMYEYLHQRNQITEESGYSPQGIASMRGENYKKNEYRILPPTCDKKHHLYHYSIWKFITDRNDHLTQWHTDIFGLESISTPQIEQNLEFLTEQIQEMKLNVFYYYNYQQPTSRTELLNQQDIGLLRGILQGQQRTYLDNNIERIRNQISFIRRNLANTVLLDSIKKAFIPFPLLQKSFSQILEQMRNNANIR